MRRRTSNRDPSNDLSKTNEHVIAAYMKEKFKTTSMTELFNITEPISPLRKSPVKTRSRTVSLTEDNLIQTGRLGKTLKERKLPSVKRTLLKKNNISSKNEVKTKIQASNNSESGLNITRHSLRNRNIKEKREVNENSSSLPKKLGKEESENVFTSSSRGFEIDSISDITGTRYSLRKGKKGRYFTSHKNSISYKKTMEDSTNHLKSENSSSLAGKDIKNEDKFIQETISVEYEGSVEENEYLSDSEKQEDSVTTNEDTLDVTGILPFPEPSLEETIILYEGGRYESTIQSKSHKFITEKPQENKELVNFLGFTGEQNYPNADMSEIIQKCIELTESESDSEEINENSDENKWENKKCYSMNTFHYEYMRLKTFKNRTYSIGNCRLFAECGFVCIYYSDTNTSDDIMYCIYCGISVTDFGEISPNSAHKLANPNCPFYSRLSFNVPLCSGREEFNGGNPLEKFNKFLEDYLIYRTTCTSLDSTMLSELVADIRKVLGNDYLRKHSLLLENDYCKFLEKISKKLEETLLFDNGLELKDMAGGGFLKTAFSDIAVCFKCNGGLLNWESTDDPKKEHARFFPECKFVTNSYSQTAINKISKNMECLKSSIPKREVELTTEETDILLEHPLSKELTEGVGLDKKLVKEALKYHLEKYAIFPTDIFHMNHVIVDYFMHIKEFPTRNNLK